MAETDYRGIDYGLGKTNVDQETGIRYGVISQHSIIPELLSDFELVYPCENCEDQTDEDVCMMCDCESVGMTYEEDGYRISDCLDSDLFIFRSPYYTFAQFCSPCVPGAGNLDCACEGGVKTYCLGADWFEDGKAPYPIWEVKTDEKMGD